MTNGSSSCSDGNMRRPNVSASEGSTRLHLLYLASVSLTSCRRYIWHAAPMLQLPPSHPVSPFNPRPQPPVQRELGSTRVPPDAIAGGIDQVLILRQHPSQVVQSAPSKHAATAVEGGQHGASVAVRWAAQLAAVRLYTDLPGGAE